LASVGVTVKLYVAGVPAEDAVSTQAELSVMLDPDRVPLVMAHVIEPVPADVAMVWL
jgi:hypothetical protein